MISINKAIYLSVIILSMIGCGKDDFENSVSFKVDGEQYICGYTRLSTSNNFGYSVLDLYSEFGFLHDGLHPEFLQISIYPFDEMKSEYPVDSLVTIFMYLDSISYVHHPGNGIFIIEESSGSQMKGSFECILSPSNPNSSAPELTITEGKFNCKRE